MTRRMIAVLVGTLVAGAACADPPAAPAPPADATTATAQPAPSQGQEREGLWRHDCLTSTGSHIPPREGRCLPSAGRVITRDEIDDSGATSASDAIHRNTLY